MTTGPDPLKTLADTVATLGEVMMALGARELLKRLPKNLPADSMVRVKMEHDAAITDAELQAKVMAAFEAAALVLAAHQYPGAQVFTCNPTEER